MGENVALSGINGDYSYPEPSLLPGEIVVARAQNVLRFSTMAERRSGISGTLYATNFRISFLTSSHGPNTDMMSVFQSNPDLTKGTLYADMQSELHIPQTCIADIIYYHSYEADGAKIKKFTPGSRGSGKVHSVEIHCKDFRVIRFGFKFTPREEQIQIVNVIGHYNHPSSLALLFVFPYSKAAAQLNQENGNVGHTIPTFRTLPDWLNELSRLRVDDTWRVADVNRDFKACPSLSKLFVCLSSLSDADINRMSLHYMDGRLPLWCWSHPKTGLPVLFSASGRPESIFLEKEETSFFRALSTLPSNTGHKDVRIVDVSKVCPSFKELQISFNKVKELCILETTKNFWALDSHWLTHLEASRWLAHIRSSLIAAVDVVNSLCNDERPVLIRENSGLDLVFVVSSLAQLILDSYYRTIRGFQTLIQKMWVLGGHPFLLRCGHLKKGKESEKEAAESPVFLHFLDCVYQLTQQFPSEFEFSETYLFGLLDTMNACMFDTFLFDSEKQREEHCRAELGDVPIACLWDFFAEQLAISKNAAPYINPLFEFRNSVGEADENGCSEGDYRPPLKVNTSAPAIKFWSGSYLRWLPTVDVSVGMGDKSSLHLQQMILMNEVKVLRHRLTVLNFDSSPDKGDHASRTVDSADLDFTDFNIDLDTSRILTASMPFVGDLALSKYYSGDLAQAPTGESIDLGKF